MTINKRVFSFIFCLEYTLITQKLQTRFDIGKHQTCLIQTLYHSKLTYPGLKSTGSRESCRTLVCLLRRSCRVLETSMASRVALKHSQSWSPLTAVRRTNIRMGPRSLQRMARLRLVRSSRPDQRVPALHHTYRRRQAPFRARPLRPQGRDSSDYVPRLAWHFLGVQLSLGPTISSY